MTGAIQQPDTGTAGQASALAGPDSDTPVRGAIHVSQGVVAKVAAYAASELPDVGGAWHGLGRRPKVTAHVDGTQAYLELVVSVRWPAPVPRVTSALRRHVRDKVQQLTGLQVGAVNIQVADLTADTAPVARVR
jgi:uncharacterized alkaline shock family protein YloU